MQRDRSLIPLSHQHQHALALCVLTDRSLAADASPENVARLAQQVVQHYEEKMRAHFDLEEQVLFPLCPGCEALTAEHRAMERMVGGLRSGPTPALLTEFTGLLRAHVRKEENELFETAQRVLSRETLDRIGAVLGARS